MAAPVEVFLSYSHLDSLLCEQLRRHLSPLVRRGLVARWSDHEIGPGEPWLDRINEHLNSAGIVLLLISADFVMSDYCYGAEMGRALERHAEGTAIVIPVKVRACETDGTPFAALEGLPEGFKAVTSWGNPDEAWASVARGVERAVARLHRRSTGAPPEPPSAPSRPVADRSRVTPAEVRKAADLLATEIGPVGRMLAVRIAAQTPGLGAFRDRIAAEVKRARG